MKRNRGEPEQGNPVGLSTRVMGHALSRYFGFKPLDYSQVRWRTVEMYSQLQLRPLELLHVFPQEKVSEPLPVVLIRSPYEPGLLFSTAVRLAAQGYHVVMQECRKAFIPATGDSSSSFQEESRTKFPLEHEDVDGVELVRWVEQQSFFNGSIGFFGQSYLGLVQFSVVDELKHQGITSVKCLAPINAATNMVSTLFPGGRLNLELVARWMYLVCHVRETNIRFFEKLKRLALTYFHMNRSYWSLPFVTLDSQITGKRIDWYRDMLEHPEASDPFWKQKPSVKLQLCDLKNSPPVCYFAGWYDIFIRASLIDIDYLQSTDVPSRIVIGPWTHWDIYDQYKVVYPEVFDWFDYFLQNKPSSLPKKARIFVLGEETWMEFDQFPPKHSFKCLWNLQPQQKIGTAYHSQEAFFCYLYDPHDPCPSIGGASFDALNTGRKDISIIDRRKDVIMFHAEAFQKEYWIIGRIRLQVYVWSDSPKSDFVATLSQVKPNGSSYILCDGLEQFCNASEEQLWRTVAIDGSFRSIPFRKLSIDMAGTAIRFDEGDCLRVYISSSSHPRWARNLGTDQDHRAKEEDFVQSWNCIALGGIFRSFLEVDQFYSEKKKNR
jgi:putative CocE/NonD family hydrolase